MARIPVDIVGDAYADEASGFANQETINLVPEVAERKGARTVSKLSRSDGLVSFGNVGTGTVRGMHVFDDVLYVVADTALYSVDSTGTETSLGTITGSGRVSITNNETQLVVATTTAGWAYTPGTSTFAQITDPQFTGASSLTYQDGYVIAVIPDSDQYAISALDDATSWAALDRKTCESATDGLKAAIADHGDLLCAGGSTIEVHKNTAELTFPYTRVTTIQRGIASSYSWAQTDNGFFFLGDDGVMYRLNQYQPARISTRPIEAAIEAEDRSTAFCFAYSRKGHSFVVLTFPGGKTWVYDAATGLWHRRKSFGVDRWRANAYAYAYSKHLVGDTTNGTAWELSDTTYAEGSDPLIAERKTGFMAADGQWVSMEEFEVVVNTGVGLTTGQGSAPLMDMAYSDDGGRTFSDFRQESLGPIGQYGYRVRFCGLGSFNQSRQAWIRVSDPVRVDLMGGFVELS
jgi:hypothetical protein